MKTHLQEKALILLLSDSVALSLAFVLAILLGHKAHFTFTLLYYYRFGFLAVFVPALLLFFVCDGYTLHSRSKGLAQQTLLISCGLMVSAILSTFIFFFSREPLPRAVYILFYVCAFALVIFFRKIVSSRLLSSPQWRALIVGDGEKSLEVAHVINSSIYLRTLVVGYVSQENGSQPDGELTRLGNIAALTSIAKNKTIDQIIVAVPSQDKHLNKILLECMKEKIKVSEFKKVIEEITGRVPVDHLNDYWFLYEACASDKRYFWYMKRLADIAVACVGLCLALPLFPFIALLIKIDSRGPIFYSQHRMGRRNVPFRVWKLRTMIDGADRNNVHWTTDKDDRITRLGKIVRKTRLDEIPQLINILYGEMSLIGPRPEALSLVEMYTKAIPYYTERHIVTPGITGWAQINYPYGNSIEDTHQKLMYDLFYVKNRSMRLDLIIFIRTIWTIFTGKGAM